MKKICDAYNLCCKQEGNKVQMVIAVNFGGKLRSYCCLKCAEDDIGESSDGRDNIDKALNSLDVFILSDHK